MTNFHPWIMALIKTMSPYMQVQTSTPSKEAAVVIFLSEAETYFSEFYNGKIITVTFSNSHNSSD